MPPSASKVKASFTVEGTALILKVSKGRGRELTYKFRNSMPAEKWAEQLLEIVEDILPNVSGSVSVKPYEVEEFDVYTAPVSPVEATADPPRPGMSEEESRRRTAAYIATFTTNDGVNPPKPNIRDGLPEAEVMKLREGSDVAATFQPPPPATPIFPEAYANRPIVSPNDGAYLPQTLDG